MNYNVRFCIACQEEVAVEDGMVVGHTILVGDSLPFDIEFCHSPFTLTSPPENFDSDWEMMVEPSQEELAIMDAYADQWVQEL